MWRLPDVYSGNLDNWLQPESVGGSGLPLRPGLAPQPNECQNNEPCLKFIRATTTGVNNAHFRTILYSHNEADLSDRVCEVYTRQEDIFAGGNNNRWIFNSNRKLYDMYIIPMPGGVGQ
jgi:hypothetical protein